MGKSKNKKSKITLVGTVDDINKLLGKKKRRRRIKKALKTLLKEQLQAQLPTSSSHMTGFSHITPYSHTANLNTEYNHLVNQKIEQEIKHQQEIKQQLMNEPYNNDFDYEELNYLTNKAYPNIDENERFEELSPINDNTSMNTTQRYIRTPNIGFSFNDGIDVPKTDFQLLPEGTNNNPFDLPPLQVPNNTVIDNPKTPFSEITENTGDVITPKKKSTTLKSLYKGFRNIVIGKNNDALSPISKSTINTAHTTLKNNGFVDSDDDDDFNIDEDNESNNMPSVKSLSKIQSAGGGLNNSNNSVSSGKSGNFFSKPKIYAEEKKDDDLKDIRISLPLKTDIHMHPLASSNNNNNNNNNNNDDDNSIVNFKSPEFKFVGRPTKEDLNELRRIAKKYNAPPEVLNGNMPKLRNFISKKQEEILAIKHKPQIEEAINEYKKHGGTSAVILNSKNLEHIRERTQSLIKTKELKARARNKK